MLARKYRLPWQVKFAKQDSFSVPYFVIKTRPNGFSYNRLGVVISKKIDKRAVVRNKIRRLIHEAFQKVSISAIQGKDTLFIVKKEIVGKTGADIEYILKDFIKK